jgi:hypothetical protein
MITICNCTDQYQVSLFNSTGCNTQDELDCINDQYSFIFNSNYITFTCTPLCPLECNRTIFKISEGSYEITGDHYHDYIKSNPNLLSDFVNTPLTVEKAKKSFVDVNFYYNSNSYLLSTQSPAMSIVSLLADLGGTLGLFLGISLIQICEIIDVLIQTTFFYRKLSKK